MRVEFARCCECGWTHDSGDGVAEALAEHARQDCAQLRGVLVPMWSIAWPWYHTPEEEKRWGLEMAWRAAGTHSARWRQFISGADPKEWWLFPAETRSHGSEPTQEALSDEEVS